MGGGADRKENVGETIEGFVIGRPVASPYATSASFSLALCPNCLQVSCVECLQKKCSSD